MTLPTPRTSPILPVAGVHANGAVTTPRRKRHGSSVRGRVLRGMKVHHTKGSPPTTGELRGGGSAVATPAPLPRQRDAATWQPRAAFGRSPQGVHPTTSKPFSILSGTSTLMARAAVAAATSCRRRLAMEAVVTILGICGQRPTHWRAARCLSLKSKSDAYVPGFIGTAPHMEIMDATGGEGMMTLLLQFITAMTPASSTGHAELTESPVDVCCIATVRPSRVARAIMMSYLIDLPPLTLLTCLTGT
jgi:hypothetical protein